MATRKNNPAADNQKILETEQEQEKEDIIRRNKIFEQMTRLNIQISMKKIPITDSIIQKERGLVAASLVAKLIVDLETDILPKFHENLAKIYNDIESNIETDNLLGEIYSEFVALCQHIVDWDKFLIETMVTRENKPAVDKQEEQEQE